MRPDEKGFTLIEIAIVLVIVGLLVGFGASMIGPMQKRAKRIEANQIIEKAIESVTGYALINNKIPTDAQFRSLINNRKDPWGKDLVYLYDNRLTSNTANYFICDSQANTAYITVQPTTGVPTTNVACVISSSGENYNNQTAGNTQATAAVTVNVADIDQANVDRYAGGGDPNNPSPYDDIVKWLPIFELKAMSDCTRENMCTGPGIQVRNTYGSNLWYQNTGGGACLQCVTNNFIAVYPSQSLAIYNNGSCTSLISQVTSTSMLYITYHQLTGIDVNKNCSVALFRDTFPGSTRYDMIDN